MNWIKHKLVSLRKKLRLSRAGRVALPRLEALVRLQTLASWQAQHVGRNPLLAFGEKHYSQNDEDGLIAEITRRVLGADVGADVGTDVGTFVELGVGDGTENNSLNLLARGWSGAWLGGQAIRLNTAGTRVQFKQCWIDRDNVLALVKEQLQGLGVAQPTLLSIDLDGNDWHLCDALLQGGVRPPIWILEYNAHLDADTRWVMPYQSDHIWAKDDYFGASLRSFVELLTPAGYQLVTCNLTGANAFFVQRQYVARFPEVPTQWQRLYMPACYLSYPSFGHTLSPGLMQALISK